MKSRIPSSIVILYSLITILLFQAGHAFAYYWGADSGLGDTGAKAGYMETNLADKSLIQLIGFVVSVVLAFVGVFFLLLCLYAGFTWMFSRGNEQDIEKAKKTLQNALIGLIVVLCAYGITLFISNILDTANF